MSPLQVLEAVQRPRVIQVIESEGRTGCGNSQERPCGWNFKHDHEPMRAVLLYHTLDGELLAIRDEWANRQNLRSYSVAKVTTT